LMMSWHPLIGALTVVAAMVTATALVACNEEPGSVTVKILPWLPPKLDRLPIKRLDTSICPPAEIVAKFVTPALPRLKLPTSVNREPAPVTTTELLLVLLYGLPPPPTRTPLPMKAEAPLLTINRLPTSASALNAPTPSAPLILE